jgi:peptide/nickel transport system substrate-binding protein
VNGGQDEVRLYSAALDDFPWDEVEHSFGVTPFAVDRGASANRFDAVADGKWVWASSPSAGNVVRFTEDESTTAVVHVSDRSGELPLLAVGEGAVWAAVIGALVKIDPLTTTVIERLSLGQGVVPSSVVAGAGAVWVTDAVTDTIIRIDPETREKRRIASGRGPTDVAVGDGAVWVANALDHTVSKIDPARSVVVDTLETDGSPAHVAADGGVVWVVLEPE